MIAAICCREVRARVRRQGAGFTPNALVAIRKYAWPGNIRELENRIKKAVVLADKALLGPEDLDLARRRAAAILPLAEAKEEFQRDYINEVLARNNGNRTKTARDLGVDPRTMCTGNVGDHRRGSDGRVGIPIVQRCHPYEIAPTCRDTTGRPFPGAWRERCMVGRGYSLVLPTLHGCVIPPSLSIQGEDAGVNSAPTITAARGRRRAARAGPVALEQGAGTLNLIVYDTDLQDTSRGRCSSTTTSRIKHPARSPCTASPTKARGSAARPAADRLCQMGDHGKDAQHDGRRVRPRNPRGRRPGVPGDAGGGLSTSSSSSPCVCPDMKRAPLPARVARIARGRRPRASRTKGRGSADSR